MLILAMSHTLAPCAGAHNLSNQFHKHATITNTATQNSSDFKGTYSKDNQKSETSALENPLQYPINYKKTDRV